jgi:hypothetical protein
MVKNGYKMILIRTPYIAALYGNGYIEDSFKDL